jgi:hypothetical protein
MGGIVVALLLIDAVWVGVLFRAALWEGVAFRSTVWAKADGAGVWSSGHARGLVFLIRHLGIVNTG